MTRNTSVAESYTIPLTDTGRGLPDGPELLRNKDQLVRRYAMLVHRIARKVRRRTGFAVELDDLVCEGTIGLLQAADRFDPARETDFEHLASVRVHGAMLDSLRRLDPLSQRRRREARRIRDTEQRLQTELGRAPTSEEMARELDVTMEEYHDLVGELSVSTPLSLEDLTTELRGGEPDQEKRVQQSERRDKMRELIDLLPRRQQLVLNLIYFNELSQKEVAKVLEVTEARISQLHKEALGRMRKRMITAARVDEEAW